MELDTSSPCRMSLFEEDFGLVAEYGYSVISIGHSKTSLLSALVDGVEYGNRATVAEIQSWAKAKVSGGVP